jgi:hypothetical protein
MIGVLIRPTTTTEGRAASTSGSAIDGSMCQSGHAYPSPEGHRLRLTLSRRRIRRASPPAANSAETKVEVATETVKRQAQPSGQTRRRAASIESPYPGWPSTTESRTGLRSAQFSANGRQTCR